jgi:hypothetical protein
VDGVGTADTSETTGAIGIGTAVKLAGMVRGLTTGGDRSRSRDTENPEPRIALPMRKPATPSRQSWTSRFFEETGLSLCMAWNQDGGLDVS